MRLKVLCTAVVTGILGVVVWAALPTTAGAADTMKFFAPWNKSEDYEQDLNDNGRPDPGEYFAGEFRLYKRGEPRGHFQFHCVNTAGEPPRQLCEAGIRVTGEGTLFVQAIQSPRSDRSRATILGGTGRFAGAEGTLTLEFRRRGAHLTFKTR